MSEVQPSFAVQSLVRVTLHRGPGKSISKSVYCSKNPSRQELKEIIDTWTKVDPEARGEYYRAVEKGRYVVTELDVYQL